MSVIDPQIGIIEVPTARAPEGRLAQAWSEFAENRIALGALTGVLALIVLALLAPWITPQDPYDLNQLSIMDNLLAPATRSVDGRLYLLGTDDQGRDMLSAIVYGLRLSLFVGVVATVIALVVGATVGIVAAYFGGRLDSLLMRIVDIQLSFPAILIALILLALLGKGIDKVVIALVSVQWAYYARTIRSSALVERRREYIEAAQCLALPRWRIIFRHLLPNAFPPLIVVATVQVAHAIALEATLSFLGVGVPITEPSLGLLIANGYGYMLSGKYWIAFYPGIALLIAIVAINLVGDQLRDVMNPRLKR
jgi:peptide/nickel transport system permease protein